MQAENFVNIVDVAQNIKNLGP